MEGKVVKHTNITQNYIGKCFIEERHEYFIAEKYSRRVEKQKVTFLKCNDSPIYSYIKLSNE